MSMPPPPPAYGAPYGYGHRREHPQGTTVLVLGVCSLAVGLACGVGLLLGPVAWIMGNTAIAEIDREPGVYSNRDAVQAGRICGIVASVILMLIVAGLVAAAIIAAAV
jgi:hypothetical protein